jgi:hypothetical protein
MAARLGDRPETILRTYAHLLPHSDVEAAEQMAALVGTKPLLHERSDSGALAPR